MKGLTTAAAVMVLGAVAFGCSPPTGPTGGLNNIGGYPLITNEVFSYLLTDPNSGLSYLEVVVADTPAPALCNFQVQTDSIDSSIANSTFALFDIYAPAGQTVPPPGTYSLGSGVVVGFYSLDSGCNTLAQAFGQNGSVTVNSLDTNLNVNLTYNVNFAVGYLQGTANGGACTLQTGSGLPACGVL